MKQRGKDPSGERTLRSALEEDVRLSGGSEPRMVNEGGRTAIRMMHGGPSASGRPLRGIVGIGESG